MSQHAAFQCLGGIDPQPRHTGRCASNTTITNSSAPPCLRGQIPAFQTGRRSRPRSRVSAAASLASFNRGERSSEYHDPSTAVLLLCDAGTASTVDDTAFTLNVAGTWRQGISLALVLSHSLDASMSSRSRSVSGRPSVWSGLQNSYGKWRSFFASHLLKGLDSFFGLQRIGRALGARVALAPRRLRACVSNACRVSVFRVRPRDRATASRKTAQKTEWYIRA